jgi:hypothetical protein
MGLMAMTARGRNGIDRLAVAIFAISIVAMAGAAHAVTPEQARAIAKEATIYGYPMVDNYKIMFAYALDPGNPQYKAPLNQLKNIARVFTPADTAVQTPNSDTPYSFAWLDLRAEPMVICVPRITKNRYFSVQLLDLYTYNFAYLGTRTTGDGGGCYVVAGPAWMGAVPNGTKQVLHAETDFVLAGFRTQLFDPADLKNVEKIQASTRWSRSASFSTSQRRQPRPRWIFPRTFRRRSIRSNSSRT